MSKEIYIEVQHKYSSGKTTQNTTYYKITEEKIISLSLYKTKVSSPKSISLRTPFKFLTKEDFEKRLKGIIE